MGDLIHPIETDTEDVIDVLPKTQADFVKSKFYTHKELAKIPTSILSPELNADVIFIIYNPNSDSDDESEAKEYQAIPDDCERAEIIPFATKVNPNNKWAGLSIILAICMIVSFLLFTVRIYMNTK